MSVKKFFKWLTLNDILIKNEQDEIISDFDDFVEPKRHKIEAFLEYIDANSFNFIQYKKVIKNCLELYTNSKIKKTNTIVEPEIKPKIHIEEFTRQTNDDINESRKILDSILESQETFTRINPSQVQMKFLGELPICIKHLSDLFGPPDTIGKHIEWNFQIHNRPCTIYGELHIFGDAKFYVLGDTEHYKIIIDQFPFIICQVCEFKDKLFKCVNKCTRYEYHI